MVDGSKAKYVRVPTPMRPTSEREGGDMEDGYERREFVAWGDIAEAAAAAGRTTLANCPLL